jgi:hypothetical protein
MLRIVSEKVWLALILFLQRWPMETVREPTLCKCKRGATAVHCYGCVTNDRCRTKFSAGQVCKLLKPSKYACTAALRQTVHLCRTAADDDRLRDGPAVLLPHQQAMLVRGTKDVEPAMTDTPKHSIAFVGIDIGKNSFHVVSLDECGAIVLRRKWSRGQVEARFANMPRCLIGMEACVRAHHLGRGLQKRGHDAGLMPARYVRPIRRDRKTTSVTRRPLPKRFNARR